MPISIDNKRIAKNSIYMTIRMLFVFIITLYTTRIVLEALGVTDYGVYNVVCGFVSLLAFLNTSISNGIQRFFNYEYGKNGFQGANRVFQTAIIIQLLLSAIIIVLAETIGLWYIYNKIVIPEETFSAALWIYQFSIITLIIGMMQTPFTAAIMAHERMDFYAIVSIIDASLKLVFAFVVANLLTNRLIIYGFLMMVIGVINFALYFIYCKIRFDEIKFVFKFKKVLFKSMLAFSGWNIFGSFAGVMKEQGINLVLNYFFGPIVNAARGVAIQVNGGLMSLVQNITVPVRPQVIQSYSSGNVTRSMHLTLTVSKLSCFVLYAFALPVIYEINFILSIWLGKDVPKYTNIFVVIIILTSFINNLNSAISGLVHATGKMKLYQVSTSITVILSVPLSYLGLKIYPNPTVALWVVFLSMFVTQIISVFITQKLIGLSPNKYIKEVVFPILIVVVTTSWIPYIITYFMSDNWLRLFVVTVLSLIAIALSSYCLGLNDNERRNINALLSKLRIKARK